MGRLTDKNQIMEGFDGYEAIKKLAELEDILEEYNVEDLDSLKVRLEQLKNLDNHSLVIVDVMEYNQMLKDLNSFLKVQNELGADLVDFINAFMRGDAFWAYHKEKRIIGEMRVENPFEQQITIKRIKPKKVIDKKKLN